MKSFAVMMCTEEQIDCLGNSNNYFLIDFLFIYSIIKLFFYSYRRVAAPFGIEIHFIDFSDLGLLDRTINGKTKVSNINGFLLKL